MDLVAIWEIPCQHKYRPIACSSRDAERKAGLADGQFASSQMREVGGVGKPIYFCVDFNVQEDDWNRPTQHPSARHKHGQIEIGELIVAYFEGINEAIHVDRVGVYGTYTTLYNLFENGLVKYGWQQTFGARGKIVDHRAQLHQYKIALPGNGLRVDQWGLTGAGGLDLDRAAHPNFGQWLSTRTTASVTDAEKQATVQAIAMATAGGPCG